MKLFSKDLVDKALKTSGYVRKIKWLYLVLEVAVSDAKSRLLLVAFSNSYPMINTNEIQLAKPLGPA